jgi:hypothetical protein
MIQAFWSFIKFLLAVPSVIKFLREERRKSPEPPNPREEEFKKSAQPSNPRTDNFPELLNCRQTVKPSIPMSNPQGSRTINDRYACQPEPISGGMADVYRAVDLQSDFRRVAVKVFKSGQIENEIIKESFNGKPKP